MADRFDKSEPVDKGVIAEDGQRTASSDAVILLPDAEKRPPTQCCEPSSPSRSSMDHFASTACLFVGDLSKECTERDLFRKFSAYGDVVELVIKRAKVSKQSLGYGFVRYGTVHAAKNALQGLNGVNICGREIRVGWAQRNCKLHIGNLDPITSEEQLAAVFRRFGDLVEDETAIHRTGFEFDAAMTN